MHIVYPGFLERVSHVSFMSGVSTFSAQSCNVTSSNATDTDASPSCKTSMTSFAMAPASRVFCCAVLPGHTFTITCGMVFSLSFSGIAIARYGLDCCGACACADHRAERRAACVLARSASSMRSLIAPLTGSHDTSCVIPVAVTRPAFCSSAA